MRLFGPGQAANVRAATGPISHYGYGLLECQGYRMQPSGSEEGSRTKARSGSSAGQGKRHWLDELIMGAQREGGGGGGSGS